MARRATNENWGHAGSAVRTTTQYRALAEATKLRGLADMSEREIKALEKIYGAKIIRPARKPRRKTAQKPRAKAAARRPLRAHTRRPRARA